MTSKLETVSSLLQAIFQNKTSNLTYYKQYSTIYSFIRFKKEKELYDFCKQLIEKYTKELVFFKEIENGNILQIIKTNWKIQQEKLETIKQMFTVLEEKFLKKNNLKPLYRIGIELWRKTIFEGEESLKLGIKNKLISKIIETIQSDRKGSKCKDDETIEELLNMFVKLSENNEIYEQWFEIPFLDQTSKHYKLLSSVLLKSYKIGQYCRKVKDILNSENILVNRFLPECSRKKIIEIIRTEFIKNHFNEISTSESGPKAMIKKIEKQDLKIVYELLISIGEKKWLVKEFQDLLVSFGEETIRQYDNNKSEIEHYQTTNKLMNLRIVYNSIIQESFNNDRDFIVGGDKSFHQFININTNMARNLPQFIDFQIRHLASKKESEIKLIISIFSELLKCIQDKDIFKKYYEFYLSRRLIDNTEHEKQELQMIKQIKSKTWPAFTLKMEEMFKSLNVSRAESDNFIEFQENDDQDFELIDIDPCVLKQSVWPEISQLECQLPEILSDNLNLYLDYYTKIHQCRLIRWQFNTGTANLYFNAFNQAKKHSIYELYLSTFQMLILLQFNTDYDQEPPSLSCKQLVEKTKIPLINMKTSLIGLLTKKTSILTRIKSVLKNEISEDDVFTINKSFSYSSYYSSSSSSSSNNHNIKNRLNTKDSSSSIPLIKIRMNIQTFNDNKKNTQLQLVGQERNIVIEATTIQIMKKHKKISPGGLITLVVKNVQNKFKAPITLIDQRIRNLMDREYLKREGNDLVYIP
ncbi:cullin [Anaeramoeba flamelloides]|uniref:Cullin n=1 Tax=Anaeramoeba flamelloides TaxID=1746091 RepID=A0ABQ8YFN5_9EUKA|nr:cullin [Anaeramoeba flamelloides]